MTEKRVHLREMTDKEYASFIFYSREHQAACLKKEKGISEEEAYVETEEELNKMLPNGKNTPGNYFMAICTRDDSVVGNMWYMHDTRREDTYLFLCDFHILQKERRKGYAFVYKVVPDVDNKFTWYINLSGEKNEEIYAFLTGRKNKQVLALELKDGTPLKKSKDFFV